MRHRVTSDAGTAEFGAVDLEFGFHAGPRNTRDTPLEVQWGVAPSTELFGGWSPYTQDESGDESGIGDVQLGLRHRFREETRSSPACLVELWTKLPTGDEEDGFSEETDYFTGFAATKTLEHMTATVYYQLGLIENPEDGDGDTQHLLSLAAVTPMNERLDVFGEVGGTREPHEHEDFWFTAAGIAWTLTSGTVLDIGLAYLGGSGENDLELFVGVSRGLVAPRRSAPAAP